MRIIPVRLENGRHEDNVANLVSRMVYPDQDTQARQVRLVMAEEAELRRKDSDSKQGNIMSAVEGQLLRKEKLGRIAGDVALKMINEFGRRGNPSLEFTTSFVSHFYTSEETKNQKYPVDVSRLQKSVRELKNSIHYWSAWQICQDIEEFDFVRCPGHLKFMMTQAGKVQIALDQLEYFKDWEPWAVPRQTVEKILKRGEYHSIPEETDFERQFSKDYFNKIAR